MTLKYVIVQQPATTAQLFLLYHGVGDNPDSMGEIGHWFAKTFPDALVVSVGSPGAVRQWFGETDLHDQTIQQRLMRRCRSLSSRCVTGKKRAACGRKRQP